jgi:6-phosphogluconolactonase
VSARPQVEVVADPDLLAEVAARSFAALAEAAIHARGRFVVALSGGHTPRGAYQRLSREPFASRISWSQVALLWGDERCVPPDHPESNYRMVREVLLDHAPIPPANVHRIRGEDDPAAAAAQYEETLRSLFDTPAGPPRTGPGGSFDLILLGLGEEGHTVSLFPGSAAVKEQIRWVMAERAAGMTTPWRVTLTPQVINAAAEILFLVSGHAKADILRRVVEGERRPPLLPAQVISAGAGRVRWLVDRAAAAELGESAR